MKRSFVALAIFALPLFAADYKVHELTLPGGTPDGIAMDYIAFDPHTNTVWVPAGNSGRVDVIDASTEKITELTTDLGEKRVHIRDRNNIRPLPDGRIVLTDIHEGKYEVPPIDQLDEASRKWLEIEL